MSFPIATLWDRLKQIGSYSFVARSADANDWNGQGSGLVVAELLGEDVILFRENGTWSGPHVREMRSWNVYRWTRLDDARVRLEHLRFGESRPVLLFDLRQDGAARWSSISPHICSEDCYTATLELADSGLDLSWAVSGPEKNTTIEYRYFSVTE